VSDSTKAGQAAGAASPADPNDGRPILTAMVEAYQKATTYADSATVHLRVDKGDGPMEQNASFAVALERPNKLRLQMYQGMAVSDGRQFYAAIETLPNQVLAKPAPTALTLRFVYGDPILGTALNQGFAGSSPQLMLLLADNPLQELLRDAREVTAGEPGNVEERACHRVVIKRSDGTAVFWIDQETYALRRLEFPTEDLRRYLARSGGVGSITLAADFTGAQFGAPVDPKAFQFEMPQGARQVKYFVVPEPAQLLAKKAPPFEFVDVEGNPVTPASLAGKVAVLDFWATWCGPCRESLPVLSKLYQPLKTGGKVVVLAVSVDDAQTPNNQILATCKELGIDLPVARDPNQNAHTVFHTVNIPTTVILDANGVVQDVEIGGNPDLATVLPDKLNRLLAGQNIYEAPLREYEVRMAEYEKALDETETAAAAIEPASQTSP